ncbi:MAG TPA: hypothetical protein PLI77_00180 [Bacteroidales bacterium]|nr:hypothetical protein [Bacteroidales bacterium]
MKLIDPNGMEIDEATGSKDPPLKSWLEYSQKMSLLKEGYFMGNYGGADKVWKMGFLGNNYISSSTVAFQKLKKAKLKWELEQKTKRQIKGVVIIVYLLISIWVFCLVLSKMY